jgi:hypothetical protein
MGSYGLWEVKDFLYGRQKNLWKNLFLLQSTKGRRKLPSSKMVTTSKKFESREKKLKNLLRHFEKKSQ